MTREEKEIIFQHVYIQRKAASFWWKKHLDLPESEEINDAWRSNQIRYIESDELLRKLDLKQEFMKFVIKKKKLEGENINANVGNF